jgi:hypothetical protein
MNFKLTKKQERIAIIGLLALIICSVGYQWAYGTNESSYKYGYGQGKSEWVNCTDFDADCGAAPDDCQPTVYVSTNDQFNGIPVNPASVDVKNVTYYNLHYYIEKKKVMTYKTAVWMAIVTLGKIHVSITEQLVSSCLKTMVSFQTEVFYGM